ncbi:hypothetical protein DFJ58DRAFT_848588 [Suillus subalutaceus]|uniref:uncharacterized protein n=1 Tax=Suillus subalutaceus TaxID=48586 RepID=UPI001B880735|nr:uncharacterized protein DFJ58DRAFT_848588 [Suillus subalutaceus]KAG1829886.1 hypothetical protein DFJ58DRAFT_848588 [Suillus subalutaceus]
MDYLQNVRITFWSDARGSPDPLDAEFRSPAMDYYLWLDHRAGGFHNECRMKLEMYHQITLKSIKNREGKDIIPLRQLSSIYNIHCLISREVDWGSYHANTCQEYDLCGAFQGSVYEENIQHLLDAVDTSMDAGLKGQKSASSEASHDINTDRQPPLEVDVMQSNIDRSVESVDDNLNASSAAEFAQASHDIDTDRQPTLEVDVTHTNINHPVGSVDENLNAISSTADATDGEHTFDESITISDTLSLSQHSELIQTATSNRGCTGTDGAIEPPKSAEHVESGLRPFPHAFKQSYCRRAISTMGVPSIRIDLSQWFIAYIVVRMREIHGLDEDTPLDHVLDFGSENHVTCAEYSEVHGMATFIKNVQTISVERRTMAQFFECASRGLTMARVFVDCAIQCDEESEDHNMKHQRDALAIAVQDTDSPCFQYSNDVPNTECDDIINNSSTSIGHDQDSSAAFTWDVETPCITPGDWMNRLTPGSSTKNNIVNDSSSDDHMDLRGRLRPRKPKEPKRRVQFAKQRRRENSPSEQDVNPRSRSKRRNAPPAVHYTLDDLIKESRKDHKDIQPCIHSFLVDPHRDAFIESNLPTEYDLLVDVARFIAGRLSKKSMSDTPMLAALSLMKIEYWLQDVADDCNKALEAGDMTLSPLARHVLLELSKRASTDAVSLSEALEIYISLRASHPGADIEYESGFKDDVFNAQWIIQRDLNTPSTYHGEAHQSKAAELHYRLVQKIQRATVTANKHLTPQPNTRREQLLKTPTRSYDKTNRWEEDERIMGENKRRATHETTENALSGQQLRAPTRSYDKANRRATRGMTKNVSYEQQLRAPTRSYDKTNRWEEDERVVGENERATVTTD